MKNYFYTSCCLLLFSCGQIQNNEDQKVPKRDSVALTDSVKIISNPSTVAEIKLSYSAINDKLQRDQLDSLSYKYDCEGERSGTVTYFTEQGKLALIRHSYNEYSHFSAIDYYFISRDSLFFQHSKEVVWSFESGQAAEGATKDDVTEKRLYIAKGKALLCLEKKYSLRSQASDNPKPESIESREVECKSIQPVLKDYGKLLAFKDSSNQDCLGK